MYEVFYKCSNCYFTCYVSIPKGKQAPTYFTCPICSMSSLDKTSREYNKHSIEHFKYIDEFNIERDN